MVDRATVPSVGGVCRDDLSSGTRDRGRGPSTETGPSGGDPKDSCCHGKHTLGGSSPKTLPVDLYWGRLFGPLPPQEIKSSATRVDLSPDYGDLILCYL